MEEPTAPPPLGPITSEQEVHPQLPASETPLLASPPRLSATGTPQSPLAETGRHAHEVWKRFNKIRLPKEKAQSTKRNFDAICQACGVTVIGKPQKMRKHLSGCQLANNGLQAEGLTNTVRLLTQQPAHIFPQTVRPALHSRLVLTCISTVGLRWRQQHGGKRRYRPRCCSPDTQRRLCRALTSSSQCCCPSVSGTTHQSAFWTDIWPSQTGCCSCC